MSGLNKIEAYLYLNKTSLGVKCPGMVLQFHVSQRLGFFLAHCSPKPKMCHSTLIFTIQNGCWRSGYQISIPRNRIKEKEKKGMLIKTHYNYYSTLLFAVYCPEGYIKQVCRQGAMCLVNNLGLSQSREGEMDRQLAVSATASTVFPEIQSGHRQGP